LKNQIAVKEDTYNRLIELQGKLKAKKMYRNFGKNMNEVVKFLLSHFSLPESERKQSEELENMYQQLTLHDNKDKILNNHIVVKKEIYDEAIKLVYSFRTSEKLRKFGKSLNTVIDFLLAYFYTDQARKFGKNYTLIDNL
jgi:hypothetical protein